MKEVLSQNNVRFAFVDICESVGKLKLFLKLRDTLDVFAEVRAEHRAGIPALMVDNEVYLIDDAAHMTQLIEALGLAGEATEE